MSTIRAIALMNQPVPGSSGRPSPTPGNRRLRRRAAAVAVPVLLASSVLLGACGSDADHASADTTAKPANTSTTVAHDHETTTTAAVVDGTVTVHAVDFNYEQLPDSVPAGTEFKLVNDADEELHEFVAFRLPDTEERSVADLMELPQTELEQMFTGPPAVVLLAKPGGPQIEAVGDGTLKEKGRYLVFCSIPIGADPDELLASDGPPPANSGEPHFHKGMYAELTVE